MLRGAATSAAPSPAKVLTSSAAKPQSASTAVTSKASASGSTAVSTPSPAPVSEVSSAGEESDMTEETSDVAMTESELGIDDNPVELGDEQASTTAGVDGAVISDIVSGVDDAGDDQSVYREECENLRRELENTNSELERSQRQIQVLNDSVNKLRQDIVKTARDHDTVVGEKSARISSLENELMSLRQELSSATTRTAATTSSSSDAVKAATAAAENKCQELQSKVAELEAQLSESSDTLEMVTLDKEQLQLEKEMLEEANRQLSADLEAALEAQIMAVASPTAGGGDSTLSVEKLQEDNAKLREALKKLHLMSKEETERLKKQLSENAVDKGEYEQLHDEVIELRGRVAVQDEQLHELQQSVDAASEYEGMIESLTDKNLELATIVSELQASVADFENEVELGEELDRQQRQEIERLRRDLDSAQVALNDIENRNKGIKDRLEDAKKIEEKFKK
jgi:chromosome segregation ATPase